MKRFTAILLTLFFVFLASSCSDSSSKGSDSDVIDNGGDSDVASGDDSDFGDVGDSGDTGDSGNSGNSGDTGDSGNSGTDSDVDNSGDDGDVSDSGGDADEPDSGDSAGDSGSELPACGDGEINGDEVCDDGELNGTYDHCKSDCSGLGEYCGDGVRNGDEVCDEGELNGTDNHCKSDCSGIKFPACGPESATPCLDFTSGLVWSEKARSSSMTWENAKTYCENLEDGGFSYWRLPTISELRTLIRNCPATVTGGSCGVTDGCLEKSCWSYPCEDCDSDSTDKYSLFGDTSWFWSSSPVADNPDNAWLVYFRYGHVNYGSIYGSSHVRCVR